MLTNEKKRQIFFKLRFENYRPSLRLEGLVPPPAGASLRFESLVSSPVNAGHPVVEPGAATVKKQHGR
ncbi:YhfG family protein [Massilia sp. CCM 8734]|uniref:YhfG family protein n=1 Tax=Massilia sp. CCM 8734 TaxID=2609283 RepID=UPI0014228550|nr:YhfG family protein [Massilia sp. CCM 8734]NHZ95261.1 hypothetical protein [Massilia sp. CCM 8734]